MMKRFDLTRLHPHRISAALVRRIMEFPHSWNWAYSTIGRTNKEHLKRFCNKHEGETLFLLANGPSINNTPLHLLKGQRVMCMNRFYIKFEQLQFIPDYLVCIEETVLDRFAQDFSSLKPDTFVNWRSRDRIPGVHYLKESFDIFPEFNPNILAAMNTCGTVTFICLQLAFYMGFSRVVLLGLDHSFHEKGLAGKTVIRKEESDESHFDPNYFPKGMKWVLPDLVKSELGYQMALDYYQHFGREIIDATIGGKCQIFPKKDLNDLLR